MAKERMEFDPDVVDENAELAMDAPDEAVGADVVDEDAEAAPLPKRCELLTGGRVRVKLRKPITIKIRSGSETRTEVYESLTLRRLTGADYKATANTSAGMAQTVLLSRLTGIKEAVFGKLFEMMDGADINRVNAVLDYFFGDSPKTGK
jgi:hypothetical protein